MGARAQSIQLTCLESSESAFGNANGRRLTPSPTKVDMARQIRNELNYWLRKADDPRYTLDALARFVP